MGLLEQANSGRMSSDMKKTTFLVRTAAAVFCAAIAPTIAELAVAMNSRRDGLGVRSSLIR